MCFQPKSMISSRNLPSAGSLHFLPHDKLLVLTNPETWKICDPIPMVPQRYQESWACTLYWHLSIFNLASFVELFDFENSDCNFQRLVNGFFCSCDWKVFLSPKVGDPWLTTIASRLSAKSTVDWWKILHTIHILQRSHSVDFGSNTAQKKNWIIIRTVMRLNMTTGWHIVTQTVTSPSTSAKIPVFFDSPQPPALHDHHHHNHHYDWCIIINIINGCFTVWWQNPMLFNSKCSV